MSDESNQVSISIFGQEYSVKAPADPEYIKKIGEYLDGKMIFRDGKRILQTGIEIKMRKNTASTNVQRGDVLFLTNDSTQYRINSIFEEDLYTYKIFADKQQ